MWRHGRALPERGQIAIFNRSHYEEVLAVCVHPELLAHQNLPSATQHDGFWRDRFEDINAFERHLVRNGVLVVKFFLHISKEEQRQRLLARIDTPDKNWKFTMADLQERAAWDAYMQTYESALSHTSTEWAPWYVVPADHKWLARVVVADVLVARLSALGLRYPIVDDRATRGVEPGQGPARTAGRTLQLGPGERVLKSSAHNSERPRVKPCFASLVDGNVTGARQPGPTRSLWER